MASDFSHRATMILFVYLVMISIVVSLFALIQAHSKNEGVFYGDDHEVRVVEGYQLQTENSANITDTIDPDGITSRTNFVTEFWRIIRFNVDIGRGNAFINNAMNYIRFLLLYLPGTLFSILLFWAFKK